jgi:N-acetylglucosaminyldiphosphoundecaprenol N-acetyl-beta-D-mannosaminyltransferase
LAETIMTAPSNNRRVNVLGVGITPLRTQDALQRIGSAIAEGAKGYICITGVHGVMEAQTDSNLRTIINHSMLTTADGRPTVWVGWLQGFHKMMQITGPDLMLHVCEESVKKGYTHFFYGGDVGVADQLKTNLEAKYPGLQVVGTYTPPFRPLNSAEENELQELVARLKPDMFWVGLSTPKQERFMAEYLSKLDTKLMIGVGAAFDIHTGRIKDSPDWLQAMGLQWVHRMAQEPRRLWKRYLYNNPRFIVRITSQLLGLRKYELA